MYIIIVLGVVACLAILSRYLLVVSGPVIGWSWTIMFINNIVLYNYLWFSSLCSSVVFIFDEIVSLFESVFVPYTEHVPLSRFRIPKERQWIRIIHKFLNNVRDFELEMAR